MYVAVPFGLNNMFGCLNHRILVLNLFELGHLNHTARVGSCSRERPSGGYHQHMTESHSDALVFFGATGDLAYKQIFPALQAMIRRGHLDMPVIGVAKAGWNLDQLKARARDSLANHGGVDGTAFDRLCSLMRYVDGDYQDPATFSELRRQLG